MEYRRITLNEAGTIVSGATPKTSDASNFGGDIPWITPADLSGYTKKYIAKGARNISQKGYESCSTVLMPAGSVLFSSRAPIGYVAIARNPICTNQGFKSIIPNSDIDSEFLYYQLKYLRKQIQELGSGTTFKEISAKKFGTVNIIVPPLPEQERIVARIEELFSELDKAVETLNTTKQQLAVYRQAVLKEAFDVTSDVMPLGEYIDSIEGGKSFKCIEVPPQIGECGIVKVSSVTWGEFNENESKTCDRNKFLPEKRILPGDFLFSRANTLQLVGNCVIVKHISKELMLSDKILRIKFKQQLLPQYALYFLRSKNGRQQIERLSTGNQESMRNIGQDRIRKILIPALDLCEQQRIVRAIEGRLSLCDQIEKTIEQSLQQAEALRQSILKQAFEGRL